MSVLAPGVLSACSAVPPPLESKEAQDSVLTDDSLFSSAKGTSTKAAWGGRRLHASLSQQVGQGNTVTEVQALEKGLRTMTLATLAEVTTEMCS